MPNISNVSLLLSHGSASAVGDDALCAERADAVGVSRQLHGRLPLCMAGLSWVHVRRGRAQSPLPIMPKLAVLLRRGGQIVSARGTRSTQQV